MSNFNDSGRFGEISNQSTVVVNCQHDVDDLKNRMAVSKTTAYIYHGAAATVDPATSRIDINDICFTVGDGKNSRRSIMNNAIPVASNCNGLMVHKTKRKGREINNPDDEEEVRLALLETIRPIGQAIGASNPLPEREEHLKLNFTVRTQGTAHILNTGNEGFCPGESVYVDLFKKNEINGPNGQVHPEWKKKFARYGFSLRKVPLKLVKADTASKNYEWALRKEMGRRATVARQSEKPLLTAGGEFANAILNFIVDMDYIANKNGEDLTAGKLTANRNDVAVNSAALGAFVADGDEADIDRRNKLKDKAFTDLINGIKYLYNDLDRRKLGTCLSFAKSGKGMDINLSI